MNEFEIIDRFFVPVSPGGTDVVCDIGDDAAVVRFDTGEYAISTDTLVEGVHFPPDINPRDLGYRLASVSLSDLAAMASIPKYATMAITIPEVDVSWLDDFSSGLGECLGAHGCLLIGGDTTKGPLVITLQVVGQVTRKAIKRSGACVGDIVGVSGFLGDARAALDFLGGSDRGKDIDVFLSRYLRPTPRVKFALRAQKYLNSAIDISDGLLADLGHVAESSHVGIELDLDMLPISESLDTLFPRHQALEYALTGGDDYELAFTVSAEVFDSVKRVGQEFDLNVSQIGRVTEGKGVVCRNSPEAVVQKGGYRHF